MKRTQAEWIKEYEGKDALWIHDGNPKRPHALLTSGKHSNGFFNSRLVIPDEELLDEAAADLVEKLGFQDGNQVGVDSIVGPQTGATKLAKLIYGHMADCGESPRFWASPAKSEVNGVKSMVFSFAELYLLAQRRPVLLCEDVLSTGGSIELTAKAIEYVNGIILPYVLVLVNRSGLTEIGDKKIVALIDHPMPMWEPHECPLCKQGSEAIRPKGTENWDLLNASY